MAGYFAWRAAPLGAVEATQVASAFYSFSPAMVAAHVPAAWRVAAPPTVVAARLVAVDRVLTTILGDQVHGPSLTEAAKLVRATAEAAKVAGRPLAAANAALDWADEPHLQLWQAATVLREHRGDGHVAALLTAGLDPCEALVSFAALGTVSTEVFASRGWTDAQWAAAEQRLLCRGWLDAEGLATARGRQGRRQGAAHRQARRPAVAGPRRRRRGAAGRPARAHLRRRSHRWRLANAEHPRSRRPTPLTAFAATPNRSPNPVTLGRPNLKSSSSADNC